MSGRRFPAIVPTAPQGTLADSRRGPPSGAQALRRFGNVVGVNFEKVVFGFFVLLAATLNFGFFIGDIDDPTVHNVNELYAAVVVNVIAAVLKFGDRTQIGAVHLSTSLVASIQLIAAAAVYVYATQASAEGLTPESMSSVVSLSGGALLANIVSVVLLVVETVSFQRR